MNLGARSRSNGSGTDGTTAQSRAAWTPSMAVHHLDPAHFKQWLQEVRSAARAGSFAPLLRGDCHGAGHFAP